MALTFERWWALLLLPAALLVVALLAALSPARRQRANWLAAGLRWLMLALVVLALAGPVQVGQAALGARQVILVDRSASVGEAAYDALVNELARASSPQTLIVQFADTPALVNAPREDWPAVPSATRGTDVAAALRFAGALLGARAGDTVSAGSVLLISDGRATTGDALAAAAELAAAHVPVDVLPVSRLATPLDVGVESVEMPVALWASDPFSVTVSLYATAAVSAYVSLTRDGQPLTDAVLDLAAGENRLGFTLAAEAPGLSALEVQVQAVGDQQPENDRLGAIARVQPPPAALIVAHRPDAGQRLQAALLEHQIAAQVVDAAGLPTTVDGLLPYQFVLLEDVSAETLGVEQLAALEAYVYAQGRGLIVFGGPSSYALGGYAGTALEDMLPVKLEPPEHIERPPASLLLLLDHSDSMDGLKLQLVKEAAMRAVEILNPRDQIGVLAFNHETLWAVPLSTLGEDLTVRAALDGINAIQPTGGTDLLTPLQTGLDALLAHPRGQQHIVLLTDGISGSGETADFKALVEQARANNITVSSIAVGADADLELLASIAEWGQGRFRLAQSPTDIPRMIVAETQYAAGDLVQRGQIQPQIALEHPLVSTFDAAEFPPLEAHLALTARPVSEADTVMVTPLDDPLLAAWQYGLGRVVVWTSDAAREWSPAWAAWDRLGQFWVQLVRYALPDPRLGPLTAEVQVEGAAVSVTLLAAGSDSRGINLGDAQLAFTTPAGEGLGVALPQTAPGEYAVTFEAPAPGAYRGLARLDKDGQHWEVPVGFVVGYSPEYSPRLASGAALLQQIAAVTGGQDRTNAEGRLVTAGTAPATTAASYAPWLLAAAVICWPLEIAARRRWRPWK